MLLTHMVFHYSHLATVLFDYSLFAMSSTETDASDVPITCKPKPKPKPRAKVKASGSKQDKPDFVKKFLVKLDQTEAFGKGCKWCNSICLKIARPFIDSLQDWRKRFAALGHEAADQELRWIFQTCRRSRDVVSRKDDDACSTGTEESGDGAMQLHNQVQLSNKQQQDVGGSESETNTSNPPGYDSDHLEMQVVEKALTEESMPLAQNRKRRRSYRNRVSSMPSVDLRKFLSGLHDKCSDCFVCVHAAQFLLGVGQSRIARVSFPRRRKVFHLFV